MRHTDARSEQDLFYFYPFCYSHFKEEVWGEGWGGGAMRESYAAELQENSSTGKKTPLYCGFFHIPSSLHLYSISLLASWSFFFSIGHMEFVAYWMVCSTIFLYIDLTVNFCYYVTKNSFHRIMKLFQELRYFKIHCTLYTVHYSILR